MFEYNFLGQEFANKFCKVLNAKKIKNKEIVQMEKRLSNELQDKDIATKETVTQKEAAEILGLKYHTARKLLQNELSIGFINYGCKTVWIKEDILNFKRRCYRKHS